MHTPIMIRTFVHFYLWLCPRHLHWTTWHAGVFIKLSSPEPWAKLQVFWRMLDSQWVFLAIAARFFMSMWREELSWAKPHLVTKSTGAKEPKIQQNPLHSFSYLTISANSVNFHLLLWTAFCLLSHIPETSRPSNMECTSNWNCILTYYGS